MRGRSDMLSAVACRECRMPRSKDREPHDDDPLYRIYVELLRLREQIETLEKKARDRKSKAIGRRHRRPRR